MHQKKPEDRASADQALKLLNSLTSQNTTTKSVPVKKLKTSQAKSNLLIEQSDENLRVSVRKPELNTRANTAQNFFTKENKGLILLAIFTGGWGLLMYWLINRYAKSGSVPKKQILRLCISSIICAASYGFFLFIPAFYWSKKLKDRELFWSAVKLLFLVFPSIIAIGANIEDEAQNPGSEVPTWVAFYLLFIFILVYRIHRRIYRTIATGQIQTSKKNKKNKSKESNKKVKSDQQPVSEEPTELGSIGEKSSPVITDSKLTTADNSWDLVETTIFDYLAGRKGKQFTIDILSNMYTGIYLQGYSEPGGYITVEAAANESVKPDLGVANRKGLIKVGWEPPSDGLPNYIKFLDLKESENTEIAKLFVETLRDGYLLEIGSFKVML
jgi:hypothetical protein